MNWMEYLDARMEFIKSERKAGKTADEIYNALFVSPTQIMLLCINADIENEKQEVKKV